MTVLGLRHPADPMIHPNILDVLVETGRLDEAEEYLADVRTRAQQIDLHALVAELVRRRGRAHGGARATSRRRRRRCPPCWPVSTTSRPGMEVQPVERARAWWTAGKVYRRGRMRRQAAEALADRGRRSSRRSAVRRAPSWCAPTWTAPAAGATRTALTQAELAVARAAAAGRRNAEIAEELYLSVKTVESLLTRCYRKLGIRSRVEIAAGARAS